MRVTRAAARAIEDETTQAIDVPSPSTPKREKPAPLGEISGNEQAEGVSTELLNDLANLLKSPNEKSTKKGRGKKQTQQNKENMPEILEDDDVSVTSLAVSEACQVLLSPIKGSEVYQIPMPDQDRPQTPPSKAVLRVRKQLTPKSHTPRFDPDVHKSPIVQRSPVKNQDTQFFDRRDSFLDVIELRSPVKMVQPQVQIEEEKEEVVKELMIASPIGLMASSLGSPLSPTTRHRLSRIEDSLEALDDMEDALDEVQQSLASVGEQPPATAVSELIRSSKKLGDNLKSVQSPGGSRASSQVTKSPTRAPVRSPVRKTFDSAKKPTPKPATVARSPPIFRATRGVAASNRLAAARKDKQTAPVRKATTVPPAKSTVASVARKPFVPTKSSKPLTVPKSQLPGETTAARLKAQREARMASKTSDASLVSGSTRSTTRTDSLAAAKRKSAAPAPQVRLTAAAQARLSMIKGEKSAIVSVPKTRPVFKPTAAPAAAKRPVATKSTAATAVRAVQPRPSSSRATSAKSDVVAADQVTTKPSANTPVKRTASGRVASGRLASAVSGVKVDSGLKRSGSLGTARPVKKPTTMSVKTSDVKVESGLKRNGSTSSSPSATKSTANSTRVPLHDRAEAAKKARVEAAERGRLASQQWAEQMKKKRQSATLTANDMPAPAA